jgi:RND family efflux transporter MFP subunit
MRRGSVPIRGAQALCGLAVFALAGCGDQAAQPAKAPMPVLTRTIELSDYAPSITLTGEIRAQVQSDLSFRASGRIIERNVDVGVHVAPDQVLAKIDPQEQEANLRATEATVQAAEAQLRQAASSFDRQKTLLDRGFTTRREYDQAEQAFRTAQGSLDAAHAQLATAQEQLAYTVLKAGVSGIITARNAEAGQVVQAAQTIFSLAQDGPRDAVFNVYETLFAHEFVDKNVKIALVSDTAIEVIGTVREVAPTVDPSTGTVRVKIGIERTPPAMTLGSTVTGSGRLKPRKCIILPWSALTSQDGKPAVWVVDLRTRAVSLRRVTVDAYQTGEIILRDGVVPGETVVTAGAQFLRPNQVVALADEVKR